MPGNPLYFDGNGDLQEMTDAQLEGAAFCTAVLSAWASQAGSYNGVALSISSTIQNTGVFRYTNTRLGSGIVQTSTTGFIGSATTGPPVKIQNTVDHTIEIRSVSAPASSENTPVYLTADGHIRTMTLAEFGAKVAAVVNRYVASTNAILPGHYYIRSGSSYANSTMIGAVATDTVTDLTTVTASLLPASGYLAGSARPGATYYLHRGDYDATDYAGLPGGMVYINANGDLEAMDQAQFNIGFGQAYANAIVSVTGSRITYDDHIVTEEGIKNMGTGVPDTTYQGYNSYGTWVTRYVNTNDYRSAEIPYGTQTVRNTTYLRMQYNY